MRAALVNPWRAPLLGIVLGLTLLISWSTAHLRPTLAAPTHSSDPPALIITEIMYDAVVEPDWEWIELFNAGDTAVDLTGWVLDDNNNQAHSAANIAAGSVPAGGTAILFNGDRLTTQDFAAAWGTGINLIPVNGWARHVLNNPGDTIGLWSSFADYVGDHASHERAVLSLTYAANAPWPRNTDGVSIYLTDLAANPSNGANWALSILDAVTPAGTVYISRDGEIGSPGGIFDEDPPTETPTPEPEETPTPPGTGAVLLITEIMYDAVVEPDWEWIELFNAGDAALDLTGWVLDDNNTSAHTSANIVGGSVPAGGTAILFNSSLATEEFAAVWGAGINLIPVNGWTRLSLNNGGDTIGLWTSFDDYAGDHQNHQRAVLSLTYAASAPWPRNTDGVSIYLTDLAADPSNGANWALSIPDALTPVGRVYISRDGEIGSPGGTFGAEAPTGTPTPDPEETPTGTPTPEPEETPTGTPVTETPTPDPEETPTPVTETPTPEPEETSIPVTETPTPEPEETHTPVTETPTPEPEETPIPVTGTPSPEPEETPTPVTGTPTPEPEETHTPVTETPTPEPEETPTPITGTSTPEPEETSIPITETPTPEPEETSIPVTETPTPEPEETSTPSPGTEYTLLITEIMYDAITEPAWEWIELFNAGDAALDLTGWVLDDNNTSVHNEANIVGGSVPAGGTAILFNSSLATEEFAAVWGAGINLIPVNGWTRLSLNNTGDTIGLWANFDDYAGDHERHERAVLSLTYTASAPWPRNTDGVSIYLTDLAADPSNGANWALSVPDTVTPVGTVYISRDGEIGSPGGTFAEDPPTQTPTPEPEETPTPVTGTPTPEPEETPVPVTGTPTPEPEETHTPVTETPTPEPEETPTPITGTSTPEPEETSIPITETPTPEPEETPTPVTSTPTPEPEETSTPITATPTPEPEETPTPPPVIVPPGTGSALIITEIMYDAVVEPDWEWIELFNPGEAAVDLAGWVLDDNNTSAHSAANIAGGSVPAGGTAILFNGDRLTIQNFAAVWGSGINLIPVTGWARLSLNNGGDTIGLWSSFDDYAGDHASHERAVLSLAYAANAPWPRNADGVSIYLTDLAADPSNGANWALSIPDTVTPVGTVYISRDGEIGSPGGVFDEDPPTETPEPESEETPTPVTETPTPEPEETPTPVTTTPTPEPEETPTPITATPTPEPQETPTPPPVILPPGSGSALIITEIMYDAVVEPDWEWIEVFNAGNAAVDLTGWVLDDNNTSAHSAANIAGGSVPAGGTAILFNGDRLTPEVFGEVWGTGINLIPVSGWARLSLNNTGDTIGLWSSFADYAGDHQNHENAVLSLAFTASAPWPRNTDGVSIYLTDLAADPSNGANWALSLPDALTPVGTVYISRDGEIGSPGGTFAEDPPTQTPTPEPEETPTPVTETPTPEPEETPTPVTTTPTPEPDETPAPVTETPTPEPEETPTPPVIVPPGTGSALIITEIMYDAVVEPDWEWIELFNAGNSAVDLTGWVLDDNNNQAHAAANIAGGSVPAGGTAILFNGDRLTIQNFAAVWGAGINLIPVSGWARLSLNNGGDTIGLWRNFDDYAGDHASHERAVLSLTYAARSPWPRNADGVSIYLTDLSADPFNGANWALSIPDALTPAGTVYISRDGEIGSPGGVFAEDPPTETPTPEPEETPTGTPTPDPEETPTPPVTETPTPEETPTPVTATPTPEPEETPTPVTTTPTPVILPPGSGSTLIITEIMYDAITEPDWEWIELFNAGDSAVDLTGWVLDDNNNQAHSAANIAGGIVPAGGTAILFNGDRLTPEVFGEVWGSGINLIPVSGWARLSLNNGGDTIGLWRNFDDYAGDHASHERAVLSLTYAARSPWPRNADGVSIYLTDLAADPSNGANWALSIPDALTPAGRVYISRDGEIGSPGGTLGAEAPTGTPTPDPEETPTGTPTPEPEETPTGTPTPDPTGTSTPPPVILPPGTGSTLIITEIMYDAAVEPDWEWIELFNAGDAAVDLTGWVLDDNNNQAHAAANIAGGSVPAGGTAILFNGDRLTIQNFAAVWGAGINLIPVSGWARLSLNNGGDTIGLWTSFDDYAGDNQNHQRAVLSLTYAANAPWPRNTDGVSIYLTDLAADPSNGANWALSIPDALTPAGRVYISRDGEIGSPGGTLGAEAPTGTPTPDPEETPTGTPTPEPEETPTGTPTPDPTGTSTPPPVILPPGTGSTLIITEIMYDAITEPDWEWIELFNAGDAAVDLTGWVLDDNNNQAHAAANIAGGSVPAGGTAILFNGDRLTIQNFAAVWGAGINLIPVSGWARLSLNNGGDTIGLWRNFDDYAGDHASHERAVLSLAYSARSPWPRNADGVSIYLTDLAADPSNGANWALSIPDALTPAGTVYISRDGEIGSPGGVFDEAPPTPTPTPEETPTPLPPTPSPPTPTSPPETPAPTVTPVVILPAPTPTLPPVPANRAPVAEPDQVSGPEGQPLWIDPLANDWDPDGDEIRLAEVAPARFGRISRDGDRLRYQPDPHFYGEEQVRYRVVDERGASTLGAITITITPVNDAPQAQDDGGEVEPGQTVTLDLLANDWDPDGDPLTVLEVEPAQLGRVSLLAAGQIRYEAGPNPGVDRFDYVVGDPAGATDRATVTIHVGEIGGEQSGPTFDAQTFQGQSVLIPMEGLADWAVEGSMAHVGAARLGWAAVEAEGIRYTPGAGQLGSDLFRYSLRRGSVTLSGGVQVSILPHNRPPHPVDNHLTTLEDQPVTFDPLANDWDADGDPLALRWVASPAQGQLRLHPDGSLTYTPPPDWHGQERIAYGVGDPWAMALGEIWITVEPVNDPPRPNPDYAQFEQGQSVTLWPLANDGDPDGDGLSLVAVEEPGQGSVAWDAAGQVTFTPTAQMVGAHRLIYTVADDQGATAQEAIHLEIRARPHPPQALDDAYLLFTQTQ